VAKTVIFMAQERERRRKRGPATSSASTTTAPSRSAITFTEKETLKFTGIPSFAPEALSEGAPPRRR
jgi:peptide subunit release factor RF-3